MTEGTHAANAVPPRRARRSMRRWWTLLALAGIVPFAGEIVGHPYFSALGKPLLHHAFHLATVILAAGVFWAFVAGDIKRHGAPPRLQAMARGWRSLRHGFVRLAGGRAN